MSLNLVDQLSCRCCAGLSRELTCDATHIVTRTTGTLSYMPPELIKDEKLMPASDVYSFAIVMWEIVAGELPMEGVPNNVAIKRILFDDWRPSFPEATPQWYVRLAEECWASDPSERPSFRNLTKRLKDITKQLPQGPISEGDQGQMQCVE